MVLQDWHSPAKDSISYWHYSNRRSKNISLNLEIRVVFFRLDQRIKCQETGAFGSLLAGCIRDAHIILSGDFVGDCVRIFIIPDKIPGTFKRMGWLTQELL
jgi:hypothetical protein